MADRQKVLKMIFPLLLLAAGYIWYLNLSGPRPGRRPKVSVPEQTKALSAVRQLAEKYYRLRSAARPEPSDRNWGRDPFQREEKQPDDMVRQAPQDPPAPELRLDAVMVDPKASVAVINGEEVALNAQIAGFVVREITAEHVLLSDGERTVELSL